MFGFGELLLIILVICGVLYFVNLKLEIKYLKEGKDDYCYIFLRIIPGILSYKSEIPVFKWEGEMLPSFVLKTEVKGIGEKPLMKGDFTVKNPLKILKKIARMWPIRTARALLPLIKKILVNNKNIFKNIHCKKLKLITEIGLSNPALTGVSVGFIWSLKSWIYSNMNKNIKVDFQKPHFEVIPNFNSERFKLNFHCIFTARTGHIIITASRLLYIVMITLLLYRGGVKLE